MGLRRSTVLAALALAALATSHPVALGAAPASPVRAEVTGVRCHDLSQLVASFPMAGQFEGDPRHVAMVTVTVRTEPNAPSAPYAVDIDGMRKSSGTVGSGGQVSSTVSLTNKKDSRVVVFSGKDVLLDQTVSARC